MTILNLTQHNPTPEQMEAGGVVGIYMTLASLVALMVLSEVHPEAKVYNHLKPSAVKVYR